MESTSPALYLGNRVAWDGDRLIVTDDELLARINKPYLSASTAKSMHSCPSRMVSDRAMPSGFDLFGAAELGTAAHTVLERLFTLPPGRRDRQHAAAILTELSREAPHFEDDVDYARSIGADPVRHTQWVAAVSNAYSGVFDIEDPKAVEVFATEMMLDGVLVAGVPFKGFIDRIDKLEGGGLGVVDFKGLALDTPIPTPSGWTTMGELHVGDQVLGSNGRPVNVTVKSGIHHRPCYRITFSDGSTVVCDNVHLWNVTESKGGRASTTTLGADALYERFTALAAAGRTRSLTITNAAPLDLPEGDLPIDPWVLGAWLGDGKTNGSTITVGRDDADDMLTLLKQHWHGQVLVEPASLASGSALAVTLAQPDPERCGMGHDPSSLTRYPYAGRRDVVACSECSRARTEGHRTGSGWAVKGNPGRTNIGLRTLLADTGLRGNKHIPVAYLRASREQRLALLQGLMDTDGSWNAKRHRAVLVTTVKVIADAVAELVVSLGVTPQRHARPYVNATRPDATAYTVEFAAVGFNPFRLPRKAAAVDAHQRAGGSTVRATRRTIVAMEPVASVPTQCIAVDAEDRLYLCGPLMVPTHNTGKDKSKVSAKFNDDHGDQIRLYVEALRVKLGEKPRAGHLYYIQHGKRRRVAIGNTDVNKTKRGFAESWSALQKAVECREFETRDSPLCGWCPLVNSCPTAAKNGRFDRKGGAPTAIDLGIPSLRPDGTVIPLVTTPSKWASSGARPADAAHMPDGAEPPRDPDGGDMSSRTDRPWREAKPYDGADIDGHLSLNSYAATAVYGLTTLAAELLVKAGQKVGPSQVKLLAGVLASTVLDAQEQVTNGSRDWQEGSNTRLRGVLRSAIDVIALPFGQDEAAWATWQTRTVRFMVAVSATAIDLYDNGPVADLAALAQATAAPVAPAAAA